jgi:hypothetical protein
MGSVLDCFDIWLLRAKRCVMIGVSPKVSPQDRPFRRLGVEVKDMSEGSGKESGRDSKDAGQVSGNHAFIPRAVASGR